ncbi:uncharacterized protein LOC110180443 [Drosophila serrata]|uniref:uncharacterized protein LOC110180443 n=1 Tax=Drosophila serrata TaxID=7274 RepID=UPI000A1D1527|nr:uncharacterized protein LOC110180443 [Drosophila serrata]
MRRVSSAAYLADVPVVANKSCEDISDIDLNDVPAQLEATLNHRRSRSSHVSLFNMDVNEFMIDSTMVDKVQQHQECAKEEEKKWYTLVSKAVKSSKELATRQYSFEPREEQQRYLKECPNLQNFIRGSLPFMNKVTRFLGEHQELVALQDELAEHVQFQLNSKVNNAINENLAGKRQS